jgi:hypothetical protein
LLLNFSDEEIYIEKDIKIPVEALFWLDKLFYYIDTQKHFILLSEISHYFNKSWIIFNLKRVSTFKSVKNKIQFNLDFLKNRTVFSVVQEREE